MADATFGKMGKLVFGLKAGVKLLCHVKTIQAVLRGKVVLKTRPKRREIPDRKRYRP
jgi:hypothetical protein